MLNISSLTYQINNQILINNLNLSASNWLFFVFGPSGSGKTTLLKLISWIFKPTKWKITAPKIIWTFWQDYNLLPLDGKTNINLPFYFKKIQPNLNWKNKLINLFEIQNLLNKDIETLSAWEKERIWIVKAFIHQPNLVLLDETWNSLHQELKEKLIKFVKDYSKNYIVFWISHDYFITSQLKSSNIIYNWNFTIYKS